MATKSWTKLFPSSSYYDVAVYQCTFTGDDISEELDVARWNDISVQMTGTFGNAVAVQGANDLNTPVYNTVKDALGNDMSYTSATAPVQVLPGCMLLKIDAAGAVTNVVITVKVKR